MFSPASKPAMKINTFETCSGGISLIFSITISFSVGFIFPPYQSNAYELNQVYNDCVKLSILLTEFSYYDIFCIKAVTNLNLSERIKLILEENQLKQKELAKELGVTESYISAIINSRNYNISQALATLIEEKYGYSTCWILEGTEPKLKVIGKNRTLSDIHKKAILQIEKLTPEQIKAVLAFIKSLEEVENDLKGRK